LQSSTALDLDSSSLRVSQVGSPDDSGLAIFDLITVNNTNPTPPPPVTDIVYGSGSDGASPPDLPAPLPFDIIKKWTATTGPDVGDVFTETLTSVLSINRASLNAITITLSGTVVDTDGLFPVGSPAFLILSANQAGGPGLGNAVSVSLTNTSSLTAPETSTWVMMAVGFGAIGYAASRRRKTNISMLSA
jgi:hypothetical protein